MQHQRALDQFPCATDIVNPGAELRGLPSLQVGYPIQFDEHRILSEIVDPSELVMTLAWDGVSNGALSSADTLRKFEFSYNVSRGRVRDVRIRFH